MNLTVVRPFSSLLKTSFTSGLILSPKPPSSKLPPDFFSLTIPSLTKTEHITCSSRLLSTNQGHFNKYLSRN
ncbi:unnamed protein product [Adineta steineri]|uniref:Uncharacterized protein n=1 Tax=Adineta steineri TaxID=433720 RepID=A0A814W410_9BILA|nr:unnamed protein product [Adineta steineri]CAF3530376.1 unnamed protein product [Adineta steineri]